MNILKDYIIEKKKHNWLIFITIVLFFSLGSAQTANNLPDASYQRLPLILVDYIEKVDNDTNDNMLIYGMFSVCFQFFICKT